MKTFIDWAPWAENNAKIVRRLPETFFECPKLTKGDEMTLDIAHTNNKHVLTPVKVASITIDIGWNAAKNVKRSQIRDAEQYVYIEPFILEKEPE
jgi:hypothetical protein